MDRVSSQVCLVFLEFRVVDVLPLLVDILLIDEILSVGDAQFRGKALNAMQNRISGEQTVVFVSHMTDQVKALCDRVIWLEHGKVVAEGPAEEVVDAYTAQVSKENKYVPEGEEGGQASG